MPRSMVRMVSDGRPGTRLICQCLPLRRSPVEVKKQIAASHAGTRYVVVVVVVVVVVLALVVAAAASASAPVTGDISMGDISMGDISTICVIVLNKSDYCTILEPPFKMC